VQKTLFNEYDETVSGGVMATHIDRIVIDAEILVGKPVVRGTRLAVEFILDLLSQGWTEQQLLSQYPGLTHEDVLACLAYASEALKSERVYPVGA
jgi:uncharacterized protein (DUF433 family)